MGCGFGEDSKFSHCNIVFASLFIWYYWVLFAAQELKGLQDHFIVSMHKETQVDKITYCDLWWKGPLAGAFRLSNNPGEEEEHQADREGGLFHSCYSIAGLPIHLPW